MPEPTEAQIISGLTRGLKWPLSVITYSVPSTQSVWTGYAPNSQPDSAAYGTLSAAQADGYRAAIQAWARLIAVPFAETDDVANPGQMRIAFTDRWPAPFASPTANADNWSTNSGDIWLPVSLKDSDFSPAAPVYGSSTPFMTLLYSVGIGLGLAEVTASTTSPFAEYQDSRYSVMAIDSSRGVMLYTYESAYGTVAGWQSKIAFVHTMAPHVYDIAAIQYLYGANPATASGDNVYTWAQSAAFYDTIYDAGGHDTIDLTAHTRGSRVDLTPGATSDVAAFSAAQQAAYWKSILPASMAAEIDGRFADPGVAHALYTWTQNLGIAFSTVIEDVLGGSGADTIIGNSAANRLSGNDGNDAIYGGAGDDTISGGSGSDVLNGGEGADVVSFADATSGVAVDLSAGTTSSGDRLEAFEGAVGSAYSDSISGSAAADRLEGAAGSDQVFGRTGDDTITAGAGQDYLRGDEGNDSISGGADFDDINGNMGDDVARGGLGGDWVVGGRDQDLLYGEDGDDVVYGNMGQDTCDGGAGADIVRGGQGDDVLTGGDGDDWLSGDLGSDTIAGGAGADTFNSWGAAGLDRVTDFNAAEGDRVRLEPGTVYTAHQVGSDTVIDMQGGGQMVLAGVTYGQLPANWIFVG